jgi:hypothetical protein
MKLDMTNIATENVITANVIARASNMFLRLSTRYLLLEK